MLKDVNALIKVHSQLSSKNPGKKGLGHITRSGIVMLCASWESYLEDLLLESLDYLIGSISSPKQLPKLVQKALAQYLKEHKHELKSLDMAGDGWEECLKDYAKAAVKNFNTPNLRNIDSLFKKFLGTDKFSSNWGYADINQFVSTRGDIAHKGSKAKYVTIKILCMHRDRISETVIEVDNYVSIYLKETTPSNSMPWKRRM